MNQNENICVSDEKNNLENLVVIKHLSKGLELEDELVKNVLPSYLERQAWPVGITDESFEKIKDCINLLISDSKKHSETIQKITSELTNDAKNK